MNKNRKKVSITMFLLFVLSRIIDAYVTWHYSPDLALEGNPIVNMTNNGWTTILVVQLLVIIAMGFFYKRLWEHNYLKTGAEEKILTRISKRFSRTPMQRFKNEFAWGVSAILMGFIAPVVWFLAHNIKDPVTLDLLNLFSRLSIGVIQLQIVSILVIGYFIGRCLANYLINNSYISLE